MAGVTVRPAAAADAAAVLALARQLATTFDLGDRAFASAFAVLTAGGDATVLVAERAGG